MLYRRKFLGGLLQIFGGRLSNIDLQKYLMLATDSQDKPLYEFTPYKYGCFSFTSYCDKRAMIRDKIIKSDEKWIINDNVDYHSLLTRQDQEILFKTKINYGKLVGNKLIKYVYEKYPYYTINSEIAEQLIGRQKLKNNREKYLLKKTKEVFSIGYEGKSIELFINTLIKNNVKILVDVRKNPFSMKYGFSKNQIIKNLNYFKIFYIHIPELGIESDKRKDLHDLSDYNKLFTDYEKTTLAGAGKYLLQINQLLSSYKRICLMCFEADPDMCHRTRILRKLIKDKTIKNYEDL